MSPTTRLYSSVVEANWLDELDHVNFLEHQRVADKAASVFWERVGGEPPSKSARLAFVTVQTNVRYRLELRLGDPVAVDTHLIGYDHRRLHLFQSILREDETVSTVQVLGLAFDASTRRAGLWPKNMRESFDDWVSASAGIEFAYVMDWGLRRAT